MQSVLSTEHEKLAREEKEEDGGRSVHGAGRRESSTAIAGGGSGANSDSHGRNMRQMG